MSIRRDERMLNALKKPVFIVDYRDEFGKRRQERTNACSLKEAQQIERGILANIDKAKALGLSTQALKPSTFAAFAEGTYFPTVKPNIDSGTFKRYETIYRLHLKPTFGSMTLASITPDLIDAYFRKARESKTERGTPPGDGELKNRRARLNSIFEMALRHRLVNWNPCRAAAPCKYDPPKKTVFSPLDEQRIMSKASEWLKPFISIGLYGGMRESEIANLKWPNIKQDFIYLPAEETKTNRDRFIPLNTELRRVLGAQDRAISDGRPVDHVFWNAALKSPYNANSVSTAFTRLAQELGFPAKLTTFHCTRWTFITRARDAGLPDARLMAITGHKTPRMLERYTNIGPMSLKGVTELLCTKVAAPVQNQALAE